MALLRGGGSVANSGECFGGLAFSELQGDASVRSIDSSNLPVMPTPSWSIASTEDESGSRVSEGSMRKIDEDRDGGLMKFVELVCVHPELRSGTPVVKSIPVECQQNLALTWFGEMHPGAAFLAGLNLHFANGSGRQWDQFRD
jgi:hypothetical protein